ncbi:AraC family transcriptional regulator [Neptunitalea chrysea]|uniref:AraC family transcriptional regulator n=1 Tax=Neptunitalea chrysea TaxID=1647581 RepID=A0A9W6EWS5_9FLAO|nr:helix-turn-helix domain-containing protein [Neptunitalea chrysea]GLB53498.1 AraC family transcriptional regulator [Neptunitalea chrysea]
MSKPDRHNEIEINFLVKGSLTYLFQDKKIVIPAGRFTVFWGLIPHQIIDFKELNPYYVCTVPLAEFLDWRLPDNFVERILQGEVLIEESEHYAKFDEFLYKNWVLDTTTKTDKSVSLLEIQARLNRFAQGNLAASSNNLSVNSKGISKIEKMVIYIAQNYNRQIKVSDIGEIVGLHPDYANSIFKKAFGLTLTAYIIEERISHIKRRLITTNHPITEIAFEGGFSSLGHFNTMFFKINKCTPREFRRRYKN